MRKREGDIVEEDRERKGEGENNSKRTRQKLLPSGGDTEVEKDGEK